MTDTLENTLKPCPFCGNNFAEQIDALLVNYGFDGLQCPICGDSDCNNDYHCLNGDGF